MIFYTSDWHLYHNNILKLCDRPFTSAEEMKNIIIGNYNARVTSKDDVFFLGDIFFKTSVSDGSAEQILKNLPGHKHLIIGNHDKNLVKSKSLMSLFETADEYRKFKDDGRTVIAFHYPILEWDGYFHGTYHIYGHIHNNTGNENYAMLKNMKSAFNAGVDVNNFCPVTLSELIAASCQRENGSN